MPHIMPRLVGLGLALLFAAPALAQGWVEPAAPQFRQAGIVAARIQNDDANSTAAMIRCVEGDVHLIIAGTGGDPPSGSGTISAGNVRVRTQFTPDSELERLIGVPASRAMVPGDLLREMAKARSLSITTTYRFGNGQVSSQTRNTSLSGFSRLMPVMRQECLGQGMGDSRQAARATPPPKQREDDGFDIQRSAPPETEPPRTASPLPAAAQNALNEYAKTCKDMGGQPGGFAGKGVYIADLNGDGALDYVYYLGGYSCPGGPAGAGFCGASGGCSLDVIMSSPQGHRAVEGWIGIHDVAISRAGNQEILELTNNDRGNLVKTRHRWNGRSFVRM
ncbi:MAG: hypothetical protein ACRCWO_08845 [Bosea sp. (in: a-proteobacteria)]